MPEKYETAFLQHLGELNAFIDLMQKERVTRYLEVGSKFGGSLWKIAQGLPKGSRLVSIDLPHGDTSFKESEPPLRACVAKLKSLGYDAHLIIGDSTNPDVIKQARDLGPYDAIFIDANHTVDYVRKDWSNYGDMARMIAFHDINWKQMNRVGKKPIEVPIVWQEIKKDHRHMEICQCPRDNGIGVLWRS